MSEQQQGPGWWLASDGRWYPPEQAPAVAAPASWAAPSTTEQVAAPPAWGAPPPAPVPPKGGISTGAKVALVVGGIVGVLVLLAVAVSVLGQESTTAFKQTGDSIGGSDSTYSEPVVIPEGFAVVQGDGVSIAVPSDWTLLDANDLALTGDDISTVFPDAPADMLEQGVDMFARGAVLVAFDFTGDSFASNINVIDVPTEAPLGVLESQAEREFGALGVDVVDSGTVVLGIGDALRVEYTFDLPLPDGSSAPGAGVQYYVPLGGHTYIVTVSSGVQAASLADAMIDTFRAG